MEKKPMYWPRFAALVVATGLLAFYSVGGLVLLVFDVDIYSNWFGLDVDWPWALIWVFTFLLAIWGTIVVLYDYYPAKLWEAQAYRSAKRQLEAYD